MAKIWCEKCKGSGKLYGEYVTELDANGFNAIAVKRCNDCNGAGYKEDDMVKVSLIRAFASSHRYGCRKWVIDFNDLINWLDSLKEGKQ